MLKAAVSKLLEFMSYRVVSDGLTRAEENKVDFAWSKATRVHSNTEMVTAADKRKNKMKEHEVKMAFKRKRAPRVEHLLGMLRALRLSAQHHVHTHNHTHTAIHTQSHINRHNHINKVA